MPVLPHTSQRPTRARWQTIIVAFLLLSLVAQLSSCAFPSLFETPTTKTPVATQTGVSVGDIIKQENAKQGTPDWVIPSRAQATTEIQAYASATSVAPGDTLRFFVSVLTTGTPFRADIYRLGWYGGAGGRLLYTNTATGQAQGYYDPELSKLVNCRSCKVDQTTGLIEANWQPSLTLKIPADWVTGVYYAKFSEVGGSQTYVQFDVRSLLASIYVVSTSDTTYEAYNTWGGASLYVGLDGSDRKGADKVSFDRPNIAAGLAQGLPYEIDAIRWLERWGYDVSYVSTVDLEQNPGLLLRHRAYINLGHDEYWSKSIRDGVEKARDAGVGLAFLGANDAYWQIRFEPDSQGIVDRTIVCYKIARIDPLYGKQNELVTTTWRDSLIGRPENALIGIMYVSWTRSIGFPWTVSTDAPSYLLNGTKLTPGRTYGCDYVGYEWDRVIDNGKTPPNLRIIGNSSIVGHDGVEDTSNTTYYIAPSGAFVFASGSIYWAYALDDFRLFTGSCTSGKSTAEPAMARLFANVMSTLIVHHKP